MCPWSRILCVHESLLYKPYFQRCPYHLGLTGSVYSHCVQLIISNDNFVALDLQQVCIAAFSTSFLTVSHDLGLVVCAFLCCSGVIVTLEMFS
jgi:hypothetical protein